jgi:glycosyltransferase involved in cell wall biosynthesis
VPIVARSGGLPEAVGECGVVFPKGDREALAQAIAALTTDPAALEPYRRRAAAHLARHVKERVARDYLEVIDAARVTSAIARTA